MKRLGFGGKYGFYWQTHWSSHTLGFPSVRSDSCAKPLNTSLPPPAAVGAPEQTCPGSSISFKSLGPLMWIQCCGAYHSCLKVQLPQYSGVWSFTYCKCYNVIIWEPVMHYTFFIKEHHHLKVECGKSQRFKVYIDRNCFWDFWVWDENTLVIVSISESALHLLSEGGKYPNKQSRITFDWGLPCHYKTNLVDWTLLTGAQRPWRLFLQQGPAIKISFSIWFHKGLDMHLGALPSVSS